MTDEEFEREVSDLVEMLKSLRLIKDKGRKRWLKAERYHIVKLTRD